MWCLGDRHWAVGLLWVAWVQISLADRRWAVEICRWCFFLGDQCGVWVIGVGLWCLGDWCLMVWIYIYFFWVVVVDGRLWVAGGVGGVRCV